MEKSIVCFSNLAYHILNDNSRYIDNKRIIVEIFNFDNEKKIQLRLTVIDSYYSTQMNKRLYGLEDISNELGQFNDAELKLIISQFLNSPNEGELIHIFQKKYGLNKRGHSQKKAISLITKYLYFLSNGQFPIYDDLGKLTYNLLRRNGYLLSSSINESNYFKKIIALNQNFQINDFEKLDNFLWLTGKLFSGSFSILMGKEKYIRITENIEFKKNISSSQIDTIIRDYIKNNFKKLDVFSTKEKQFMEFVFSLE